MATRSRRDRCSAGRASPDLLFGPCGVAQIAPHRRARPTGADEATGPTGPEGPPGRKATRKTPANRVRRASRGCRGRRGRRAPTARSSWPGPSAPRGMRSLGIGVRHTDGYRYVRALILRRSRYVELPLLRGEARVPGIRGRSGVRLDGIAERKRHDCRVQAEERRRARRHVVLVFRRSGLGRSAGDGEGVRSGESW